MDSWRDWLPEAAIGTGVTTGAGLVLRLLGHQPLRSTVRTIATIKNALFDFGNLWLENEALKADIRALEEALAHATAREARQNAPRRHPDSNDSPPGSTGTPEATSPSGPNARQQTRRSSRRSVRRKRDESRAGPTSR